MLRAQELALIDPLSLLIALPSEPLVQAPSVPGPEGLAAYSWHRQQRAPEQSPPEQDARLPPCRECVKYWMGLPAHRSPGVHLHGCSLLAHRCMSVCVPPCGSVHVCTGSVYVGLSTSAGSRAQGLFVCWYMCVCLFPSCTHWYYLCPCVYLCTCGCLVICA